MRWTNYVQNLCDLDIVGLAGEIEYCNVQHRCALKILLLWSANIRRVVRSDSCMNAGHDSSAGTHARSTLVRLLAAWMMFWRRFTGAGKGAGKERRPVRAPCPLPSRARLSVAVHGPVLSRGRNNIHDRVAGWTGVWWLLAEGRSAARYTRSINFDGASVRRTFTDAHIILVSGTFSLRSCCCCCCCRYCSARWLSRDVIILESCPHHSATIPCPLSRPPHSRTENAVMIRNVA